MPIRFCVFVACLFLITSAFASPVGQEELQKRLTQEGDNLLLQRDMARSVQQPVPVLSAPADTKNTFNAGSAECLPIEHISFEGITKINASSVIDRASAKPKCITKEYLESLQRDIQMLYVSKGFITTRVYFDLKNIAKKEISVVAQEGVLEQIILINPQTGIRDTSLSARMQTFDAFPFDVGNVLNLRSLEQGVEQMNKLSSNNITMQIRPGESDGGSILALSNQELPTNTIGITADNNGTKSTGKYRSGMFYSKDNLLSLNDNFYLNGNTTIGASRDYKYSDNITASLTVPLGFWTFSESINWSRYLTTTKGIVSDIESSGTSFNNVISSEYLLSRGQRYKTSLGGQLAIKDSKNYIEDVYIDVSSRILSIASLYMTGTYYGGAGSIFGRAAVNRGLNMFGAKKDSSSSSARAQFTNLDLYLNYYSKISFLTYNISADGQYSFDNLFASEQMMIGGGSVRGFKENNAYGDHGFVIKQDLTAPLSSIIGRSNNEYIDNILSRMFAGVFADYGFVKYKDISANSSLAGAGAKINYYGQYLRGGVSYARSLYTGHDIESEGNVFCFNLGLNILF